MTFAPPFRAGVHRQITMISYVVLLCAPLLVDRVYFMIVLCGKFFQDRFKFAIYIDI